MTASDPLAVQVGGNHYKKLAIQPMVFATANRYDPCSFSILKYVTRWRDKGGVQDLNKALHIAQMRQSPDIEQYLPEPWFITATHTQRIAMREYMERNGIPDDEARILEWLDIWVFKPAMRANAGQMVVEGLTNLIAQQEGSQNG